MIKEKSYTEIVKGWHQEEWFKKRKEAMKHEIGGNSGGKRCSIDRARELDDARQIDNLYGE